MDKKVSKLHPEIIEGKADPSQLEGRVLGYIRVNDCMSAPVVYLDKTMHQNSPEINIALSTYCSFDDENYSLCIIVDSLFLESGSDIQTFFLLHEIGHIVNNDVCNMISIGFHTSMTDRFDRDSDLKADTYAFMRLNDQQQDSVIEAFTEMIHRAKENAVVEYFVQSLKDRLENMEVLRDKIRSATDQEINREQIS